MSFLGGRVRMGDVGLLGGGYVGVGTGDLGIWIVWLVGRGVLVSRERDVVAHVVVEFHDGA